MFPAHGSQTRGVYTLANDAVTEWFEAFIRSFRSTNPDLPLVVIPYNQNISRIEALQKQFHFEIMAADRCSHFDALADQVKVGKNKAGCFRKFACFFGDYREFLFLDADTVTLVPLERLFDAFSHSSIQLGYFDTAMDMCYNENLAAQMVSEYHSPAYNSGVLFSRSGLFAESEIFAIAKKAAAICDGFADCAEQPFLNYVTDLLRLKCARVDSFVPEYAQAVWARQPFVYDWKRDEARDATGKVMPFIHWPGCAFLTMVKPEIFLRHRTWGMVPRLKIQNRFNFYFKRYSLSFLKQGAHAKKVVVKAIFSARWRKFYFFKLLGIKIKLPD